MKWTAGDTVRREQMKELGAKAKALRDFGIIVCGKDSGNTFDTIFSKIKGAVGLTKNDEAAADCKPIACPTVQPFAKDAPGEFVRQAFLEAKGIPMFDTKTTGQKMASAIGAGGTNPWEAALVKK